MARKFLTAIDLSQNEIQNARVQNLAAAPSSPVAGQTYFDSVLLAQYTYNGTAWVASDASKVAAGAIPNTALATNPLARTNHTGSQTASTISDFATTAQGYHLNQFAVPTANLPMGGFKLTGLATPTTAGDSAEYSWVIGQVQSAAAGIASKPPVRIVATTNLALSGLSAIDGVTPVAGDRVLATGQTTASQNGVYNAASTAWSRTTIDGAAPGEIEAGSLWLATEGTAGAGTQWRMATTGALTVGTTSLSILQFGSSGTYTAANGITLTGSAFSVAPKTSGGIVVDGTGVSVDTTIVARKYAVTIGDGTSTSYTVTHNLGTQDVDVTVRLVASAYGFVEVDISATSTNTVTVAFATAPAASAYRVVVVG